LNIRAVDTAARYGGDEFVLVLPEARENDAHKVAMRIHEVMRNDPEKPLVSASIGVSTYRGESGRIEKLLSDADKDLYRHKSSRQKRVIARTSG
jgi:diguanylate cyclase (GGDEF)-like protein